MQIEESSPSRQQNSPTLLEAALKGRVEILDSLIEMASLSGKPLHVSSLMGHFGFTWAILDRHPEMASDLDTYKRSPLHLASAEGHVEIVKLLLQKNDSICLDCDEGGRIPLHLAAMRGQTDVIRELIRAKPDSINLLLDGDTALHLCVKNNHFDALKILVEMIDDKKLIKKGNKEGNTVVHLATQLRHVKTLKYLISEPKVGASTGDTVNKLGFKALDILEHDPRDSKTKEIRRILIANSRKKNIAKLWFEKLMHCLDYQGNWMKEMRGALMIVATVIATISFQVATNPPGGVLQANYTAENETNYQTQYLKCIKKHGPNKKTMCQIPGQAVLGYVDGSSYYQLVIFNSVAFVASVAIILLIITGFPLKNKLFIWFLTLTMGVAVTSLAITYLLSCQMISPIDVFSFGDYFKVYYTAQNLKWMAILLWSVLLILVGAINIIRLLYWVGRKFNKLLHKMLSLFRTKREATANDSRQELRILMTSS